MKDFEIRCEESHLERNGILYGKFSLGPFLPGQATTFGNALRRSLLSELSGLAITAFEIVGVMQEFSTLPGLRESILDLSLNFKQIVLTGTLPCSTQPIGFLNVRGPAIIKAIDLKLPPGVYCVSPEQYIATLASTGTLNLKFIVSVGKGHSTQPYALYRSLSKVKLDPIFNFNSVKNNIENHSFAKNEPSKESFARNEPSKESLPSSIASSKESLAFSNTSSNDFQVLYEGGKNVKSLYDEPVDSLNNTGNHSALEIDPFRISYSRKNDDNFANLKDSLKGSPLMNDKKKQPLSYMEKENTAISSFSESANIQKQIFQRINPQQVLSIDAVFTPILKVNFSTQMNERFETIREDILLEIWTNGSIHPKRALEEATLSLTQNFQTLLQNIQQASSFYKGLRYWNYLQPANNYGEAQKFMLKGQHHSIEEEDCLKLAIEDGKHFLKGSTKANEEGDKNFKLPQALYNLDIGNLNFSLQTFIQLKKAKINTLSQLLNYMILNEKNSFLNKKTVTEIKSIFNKFGNKL